MSAESVVSCSATGRPAPTVTLTVLQQNLSFSHYNSSSVTHSNGTVTVTTTALLSASCSTQVGCSVSVLSAAPREKMITVPEFKETSFEELAAKLQICGTKNFGLIFGVLVFGVLVALLATFYLRQTHQNRKPQMEKNSEDQISIIKNEEMLQPQKNTEEPTSVIIYRQSSRQSPTTELPTKLPTTPDVESCPPEPHPKVAPKKSI
ncbi:PREDICTED: uncharacterized protein LOC107080819 [Cyprinodon variegatus]|uniref:uncharacterized protein LOC107080819 n=1 Tax=Cyprinodon variegatus TaxID=28743 RepID=UPI0007429B7D|nr:PREDICTED: uncharacterized protein LOC107080819 [Cyprinodon variegatus]